MFKGLEGTGKLERRTRTETIQVLVRMRGIRSNWCTVCLYDKHWHYHDHTSNALSFLGYLCVCMCVYLPCRSSFPAHKLTCANCKGRKKSESGNIKSKLDVVECTVLMWLCLEVVPPRWTHLMRHTLRSTDHRLHVTWAFYFLLGFILFSRLFWFTET